LRQIGGEVGRIDLSERGGEHEVCVARDNLAEGGFSSTLGVIAQELGVVQFVHLNH